LPGFKYCIYLQLSIAGEEKMNELTPRQAQILRLIREHVASSGFPPTRAEICYAMGFRSPNAAEEHLRALARKGAIEMAPGASRGIRLRQAPGLPLIGRVAAGSPILAEQHIEARYRLDPVLFNPRADYLLRVRGMSMRDAGILDGDLLAVHRAREARSGQIVVARINDDVTVKRLRRQGGLVRLLPENPEFKPIHVNPQRDSLVIEGIGVGVIRNGKPL
jgi:repressor LexA